MKLLSQLKDRWHAPNGYRRVLVISLPLVVSMGSTTLMLYTDRVFLGHYSVDALAAATPAGLTAFMFIAFFLGIVGYANTFVAQYTGSGDRTRVGASLWQAIYFSLIAGGLLALISLVGGPLFKLGGHEPEVQVLEVVYFRILLLGGGIGLVRDAMSCFYSGRGMTRTIMIVNIIGATLNIPLDYALINGMWGFPEWGIMGAGIATVCGHVIMFALFAIRVFTRKNDRAFCVRRNWRFNPELFGRLLRFGAPAGIQFFIDIFAFSFFIFMVGRLGKVELTATNIAFATNMLAFLPMIGFAIATSTLVGQAIGAGKPDHGVEVAHSSLHLTVVYMSMVALVFLLLPGPLVDIFRPAGQGAESFAEIRRTAIILLRFVAAYTLFDALTLIYSSAIKGAGDTRFVGWTVFALSTTLLIFPVFTAIHWFGAGIYVSWCFATFYVCVISLVFRRRFRQGKWKSMRVIEPHPAPVLQKSGVPGCDEVI